MSSDPAPTATLLSAHTSSVPAPTATLLTVSSHFKPTQSSNLPSGDSSSPIGCTVSCVVQPLGLLERLHAHVFSAHASSQTTWRRLYRLPACSGAYGTDDDFNLEDALGDVATEKPKPKPPKKPADKNDDFDLSDFFDNPSKTTTKPPRTTTKPTDDRFHVPTTKKPRATKLPPKRKPDPSDFDLSDALDGNNDGKGSKEPSNPGGGGFSDSDLEDALSDGFKPDKKKGGGKAAGGGIGSTDSGSDTTAETGTIAGIASALGVALLGAVTSYISYQKKKFCFSIQEGLNAQYVKGEHMEAVVTEEPQVKYSTLECQSAVPLTEETAKI
ncbi:CD99 antigen-like protein 2 isoform X3 [Ascaphus truei]|uniref:CD99 antigen-like protein 2 isoform X3 n=1 Tax=Ascaphus truei TaxID=8439 RepID=UPI003F59470B